MVLREVTLDRHRGAAGVPGAVAAGRLIRKLLFGLSPADPVSNVRVAVLLMAVAALAGYVTAHRATRSDSIAVLRPPFRSPLLVVRSPEPNPPLTPAHP
jgi:hypothetical protein